MKADYIIVRVKHWLGSVRPEQLTEPEPEEQTAEPGKFKPLSLFDKYMFAKSYIRLLKVQLDNSRKRNRQLQDEIMRLKKRP